MSKVQASPTFRAGFASDEVFDSTVAEVCVREDNNPTALASTPLVCYSMQDPPMSHTSL